MKNMSIKQYATPKLGLSNQPYSSEEIYNKILNRIISLELEPGQRISENQMAQEYGVSRSVIRTSFIRLHQLRLLEVYPQRGNYVSLIDLSYISDVLILRTAVEKEAIYEVFTALSENIRKKLVKDLESNLEKQNKYVNEKEYKGNFPKLDSEFHKMLLDSVGRYHLMEMLYDHMIHIARWRNFDVAFDHRVPQLIKEHTAILDGIKADNLLLAQEKMAEHLETITGISDRAVAKFPTYFRI